jgi:hypothetical protein
VAIVACDFSAYCREAATLMRQLAKGSDSEAQLWISACLPLLAIAFSLGVYAGQPGSVAIDKGDEARYACVLKINLDARQKTFRLKSPPPAHPLSAGREGFFAFAANRTD